MYFPSVLVIGFFDARNYASLKRVTFVNQLVNTFGVRAFDVGQSLQISRLPGGVRFRSRPTERRISLASASPGRSSPSYAARLGGARFLGNSFRFDRFCFDSLRCRLFRNSFLLHRALLSYSLLAGGGLRLCPLLRSGPLVLLLGGHWRSLAPTYRCGKLARCDMRTDLKMPENGALAHSL